MKVAVLLGAEVAIPEPCTEVAVAERYGARGGYGDSSGFTV